VLSWTRDSNYGLNADSSRMHENGLIKRANRNQAWMKYARTFGRSWGRGIGPANLAITP
jgi:hypothetical protein